MSTHVIENVTAGSYIMIDGRPREVRFHNAPRVWDGHEAVFLRCIHIPEQDSVMGILPNTLVDVLWMAPKKEKA